MWLRKSVSALLERRDVRRYLCSLGNPVVEEKFILPGVSSQTGAIVKILYERDDNPPTTAELWDAVQEYHRYPSKGRLKFDLAQLKAQGYIVYRPPVAVERLPPGPERSFRLHLTTKAYINELKPEDRWRGREIPDELRAYLLPGMPLETTPVVKALLESAARPLRIEELWKSLEPLEYYEDLESFQRILIQLKTARYVRLDMRPQQGRTPQRGESADGVLLEGFMESGVSLLRRVEIRDGKLSVYAPKKNSPEKHRVKRR